MDMSPETTVLHRDHWLPKSSRTSQPITPSLHLSTTFHADDPEYVYSRYDQPIVRQVEAIIGSLEPGGHAVTYSSGLAAVWASLVLFRPERIFRPGGYHGTAAAISLYLSTTRSEFGVAKGSTESLLHHRDDRHVWRLPYPAELRTGDLVWIETPRNP
jgi:cystathionine beta-lyase/cystathionine gamma-synthase